MFFKHRLNLQVDGRVVRALNWKLGNCSSSASSALGHFGTGQVSLFCWASVFPFVKSGLLKSLPALHPVSSTCLDILRNQKHIVKILIPNALCCLWQIMHMKIMYNPIVEEKFYLDEVHRTLRSAVIVMVTLNKSLEKMVTKCHKLLEKSLFVYQL